LRLNRAIDAIVTPVQQSDSLQDSERCI
jgi:hypothetical protein